MNIKNKLFLCLLSTSITSIFAMHVTSVQDVTRFEGIDSITGIKWEYFDGKLDGIGAYVARRYQEDGKPFMHRGEYIEKEYFFGAMSWKPTDEDTKVFTAEEAKVIYSRLKERYQLENKQKAESIYEMNAKLDKLKK